MLSAMLMCIAGLFTACSDDRDSNPTLIQPTEFVLNTPTFANETVNLEETQSLTLSWSQPKYTLENAPINAKYEIQMSPTNSFTTDLAEALADETESKVADYVILDETYQTCKAEIPTHSVNKALQQLVKWGENTTPLTQTVFLRVNAFVEEGSKKLNAIISNVVKLEFAPYYIELRDAAPIMWYLVGNNIMDGSWGDDFGVKSTPMFLKPGFKYDKASGAGEITYLNYFTNDGWKIQPQDFNWDLGFMSSGSANEAVFRNGEGDKGNIWVDPEGYYLVTVNTSDNTCSIEKQDITPTVYSGICITGSFNDWADLAMTPANKVGENHVWVAVVEFDALQQVKFKIPGSWDVNWGFGANDGDIAMCGKGTNGGKNIGVDAGKWIISFNDITGEFSITKK